MDGFSSPAVPKKMEGVSSPAIPAWRALKKAGVGHVASPQTPTRVTEALKEIIGSPSPSVQTLVNRQKEKDKQRELEREKEKAREMQRQEMLKEAALLRAVRRRRADAARDALRLAEMQLAAVEEATPLEVKEGMAQRILILRRELAAADEEHKNACLLEKECISDVNGSPEKLNISLMQCPTPRKHDDGGHKSGGAGSKDLQKELCEAGDDCIKQATAKVEQGQDVNGARRLLREARELFLDAGDELLNDKLVVIQGVERLIDEAERRLDVLRREARESALQGVAAAIGDCKFTDAWKLLGQAQASISELEEGSSQLRQDLEGWEKRIRDAERAFREKEEAEIEEKRRQEWEAEEVKRECRRLKELGDESLEMAMETLKKDDFALAKTLVSEAGGYYDKAGVDMKSGIAAILQRAIMGEKLMSEKEERKRRELEERGEALQREEDEAKAKAEQEENQRVMNKQLGDNAMRDARIAFVDRRDLPSAWRLLGLAEAAYIRAGNGELSSEYRTELDAVVVMIKEEEEEREKAAIERERLHRLQIRGKAALDAAKALAGEGDLTRAQALWQEARELLSEGSADDTHELDRVARDIVEAGDRKRRQAEEEARRAHREELARREREEVEREKAAEEERRAIGKEAEGHLMRAAQAFSQDMNFDLARDLVRLAHEGFMKAGKLDQVKQDIEGMLVNIEEAERLVEMQMLEKEKEALARATEAKMAEAKKLIEQVMEMLEKTDNIRAARSALEQTKHVIKNVGVDMSAEFDAAEKIITLKEHAQVEAERTRMAWANSGDDLLKKTLAVLSGGGTVAEARRKLERTMEYYDKGQVLKEREDQIRQLQVMISKAEAEEEEAAIEYQSMLDVESGLQSLAAGNLEEAMTLGEKARRSLQVLSRPSPCIESAAELVERVRRAFQVKAQQEQSLSEASQAIGSARQALDQGGDVAKAKEELGRAMSALSSAGPHQSDVKYAELQQVQKRIAEIEEAERKLKAQERREAAAREAAVAAANRVKEAALDAVKLTDQGHFDEARAKVKQAKEVAKQIPNIEFEEVARMENWIDELEAQKKAAEEARIREEEEKRMEEMQRVEEERRRKAEEEERETRRREEEARRRKEEEERERRKREEDMEMEMRRRREEEEERRRLAEAEDIRQAQLKAERLKTEREEAARRAEEERLAEERELKRRRGEKTALELARIAEEKRKWEEEMAAEARRDEELRMERQKLLMEAAREAEEARHERLKRQNEEMARMKESFEQDQQRHRSENVDSALTVAKLALEEGDYVKARIALKNASVIIVGCEEERVLLPAIRALEQDIDQYELQEAKETIETLADPAEPRYSPGPRRSPAKLSDKSEDRLDAAPSQYHSAPRITAHSNASAAGSVDRDERGVENVVRRQSVGTSKRAGPDGDDARGSPSLETWNAAPPRSNSKEEWRVSTGSSAMQRQSVGHSQAPRDSLVNATQITSPQRGPEDKTLYPWSTQEEQAIQDELDLIMGGLTVGASTQLPSFAAAAAAAKNRTSARMDFLQ